MTSPTSRAARGTTSHATKSDRSRGRIEGFLIGILSGLALTFATPSIVALLPGPKITATVQGLKAVSGNAAGCTFYQFQFLTPQPLDSMYIKMQFPRKITNFKVGQPQESITRENGRVILQAYEGGKASTGECEVIQFAATWNDARVSADGNVLIVVQDHLSAGTWIMGMIAVSQTESSGQPVPDFWAEGEYVYTKLNNVVRKPINVTFGGIADAK